MPTNTEEISARARRTDRGVQINTLEMKIRDLNATFEAESQKKYAAVMDHLNSLILAIQKAMVDRLSAFSAEHQKAGAAVSAQVADLQAQIQENPHDASALTTMANTATSHRSCIG